MTVESTISVHSIVSIIPDQVSADLEGETVILHLGRGEYFSLNDVGSRIWDLIQEPKVVSEVRDTILSEYDVEPEQCEVDVLSLLEALAAHGLVQARSETND